MQQVQLSPHSRPRIHWSVIFLFMCVANFISVNRKLALCCKVGDTRIFSWNKFGFSLDSNSVPRPGVNLWKTKRTFSKHSFSFLTFEFETYLLSTVNLLLHAFKHCHSYHYNYNNNPTPWHLLQLRHHKWCSWLPGPPGHKPGKKKHFLFFKSK